MERESPREAHFSRSFILALGFLGEGESYRSSHFRESYTGSLYCLGFLGSIPGSQGCILSDDPLILGT